LGILTKISIVVLVVLVLLACPVFITQAVVGPSYREAYDAQVKKSELAEQAVRAGMLDLQKVTQERNDLAGQLRRDTGELQAALDVAKNQLVVEKQKSDKLSNDLSGITLDLNKLRADYENNSKRTTALTEQRDSALKKIEALSEENRRFSDTLKQSQLEMDRLNEVSRTLREQIAERDDRIRQLEQQVGGAAAGAAARAPTPVTSEVRINGTVTAVNGDLASINVGSAKGVKPGMSLIIYRGAEYVAKLRVDQVDVGQSAGVIIDKRLDVAQGDKVTDKLD
jgi:uncharacterized protein YukE